MVLVSVKATMYWFVTSMLLIIPTSSWYLPSSTSNSPKRIQQQSSSSSLLHRLKVKQNEQLSSWESSITDNVDCIFYHQQQQHILDNERRNFLQQSASTVAVVVVAAAAVILPTDSASAVEPITIEEAEGRTNYITLAERKYFRPVPLKVLRLPLDQQFAIILMRTSYSVTDELDFIPMNQFQRDFFLIRSAEYQDYITKLDNAVTVQQGVLSDPYYFDFISLAQYTTINRAIVNNPPIIFEEIRPVSSDINGTDLGTQDDLPLSQRFEKVIIRRDLSLSTSDVLIKEHDKRVGDGILKYFDETFGSNPETALPQPNYLQKTVSIDIIERGLKQIINLFLINGYAFSATPIQSGTFGISTKFVYTLTSPATLWSGMTLQYKKAPVQNNFVIKTMKAFVRRMGYWNVVETKTEYRNNIEVTAITVIPFS